MSKEHIRPDPQSGQTFSELPNVRRDRYTGVRMAYDTQKPVNPHTDGNEWARVRSIKGQRFSIETPIDNKSAKRKRSHNANQLNVNIREVFQKYNKKEELIKIKEVFQVAIQNYLRKINEIYFKNLLQSRKDTYKKTYQPALEEQERDTATAELAQFLENLLRFLPLERKLMWLPIILTAITSGLFTFNILSTHADTQSTINFDNGDFALVASYNEDGGVHTTYPRNMDWQEVQASQMTMSADVQHFIKEFQMNGEHIVVDVKFYATHESFNQACDLAVEGSDEVSGCASQDPAIVEQTKWAIMTRLARESIKFTNDLHAESFDERDNSSGQRADLRNIFARFAGITLVPDDFVEDPNNMTNAFNFIDFVPKSGADGFILLTSLQTSSGGGAIQRVSEAGDPSEYAVASRMDQARGASHELFDVHQAGNEHADGFQIPNVGGTIETGAGTLPSSSPHNWYQGQQLGSSEETYGAWTTMMTSDDSSEFAPDIGDTVSGNITDGINNQSLPAGEVTLIATTEFPHPASISYSYEYVDGLPPDSAAWHDLTPFLYGPDKNQIRTTIQQPGGDIRIFIREENGKPVQIFPQLDPQPEPTGTVYMPLIFAR